MKLDIEPRAALNALANHIDHQRAALLDANDRHTEELDIAHAEANCLRQVIDERQTDIDRLTTALGEANAARIQLNADMRRLQAATRSLRMLAEPEIITDPSYLADLPAGSALIDGQGVMWQRWNEPGLSDRWYAHSPRLLPPMSNGQRGDSSGKWTADAILTQRGPAVRLIYMPTEDDES